MQHCTDLRINLLPWREARRQGRKLAFLRLLGGCALLAVLVIALMFLRLSLLSRLQEERNSHLEAAIAARQERLIEVRRLAREREAVLARLRTVEGLQRERTTLVQILRELTLRLENGVFFTSLDYADERLRLLGVAESGERISAQLRSLAGWELFTAPDVTAVNSAFEHGPGAGEFQVSLQRIRPDATSETGRPR